MDQPQTHDSTLQVSDRQVLTQSSVIQMDQPQTPDSTLQVSDRQVLTQSSIMWMDQPQTHHSTLQVSDRQVLTQSSVIQIIHHDLSLKFLKYLKSHCVRELTAANIVSFSYINLSQGSVATQLRCGGSFSDHFIAYFLLSVPVKEFGKSVSIWTIVCCLVFIGPRCTTIKVKLLLVLCIWLTLYRVNVSWARCPERICALL